MGATLTAEHIDKLQKLVGKGGRQEILLKIENGKVVILLVTKKIV